MRNQDLSGEWRLIRAATGESIPAAVPGDTHSALLAAGRIPDPYAGTSELDVQWVGREDWIYERSFSVEPGLLAEDSIQLSCDCLDTLAEILLNGKTAGRADNMFVRWVFEVKHLLKKGRNTIRIRFRSAEKAAQRMASSLPYPVPHSVYPVQSPHRNLVRKVQCHSGWDWGPCLVVAGIPGGIRLEASSAVRISYVYTEQRHTRGTCRLRVFAECEVVRAGAYELTVACGGHTVRKTVTLARGACLPSVDLVIEEPLLWWPNGYGGQPLYELAVDIGGDSVTKKIGLRKLELVNREDRFGLSMVFRVNGVEVFCKGANWIPFDALPQRQTPERLEHLLASAVKANMNMLRVWGGGQYESEDFYRLCDEKGLLVWQDMMFSCALYPATPEFLASVDREVRHQVKRLRDHPCIALWCGNNEDVGALTWFPESRKNRDRYIVDYDRLNEGVIGRAVDQSDPTRTFWPSSPSAGRGDYSDNWHDDSRGDMHFWSVWHEGKSFDAYATVSPRFCSEFGFQSFPSLETIRSYAGEGPLNVTSPVMEHHQRHPRGNSLITESFTRYFRFPEGFENFVYLSQVQQALAMKTAVEHWRRSRPQCMGTLYWQLNDTWPVCSWSSIDYGGNWKLLHYAARRFFSPVLLSAVLRGGRVEVWLTSDLADTVVCTAEVTVMDLHGGVLHSDAFAVSPAPGTSRRLKAYALSALAPRPESAFLHLTLVRDGQPLENGLFFTEYKRCDIAEARVSLAAAEAPGGFSVTLTTDMPAFFVTVDAAGIKGEFDDNCITLLPQAPRTLSFVPRESVNHSRLRQSLGVRHLRGTYP